MLRDTRDVVATAWSRFLTGVGLEGLGTNPCAPRRSGRIGGSLRVRILLFTRAGLTFTFNLQHARRHFSRLRDCSADSRARVAILPFRRFNGSRHREILASRGRIEATSKTSDLAIKITVTPRVIEDSMQSFDVNINATCAVCEVNARASEARGYNRDYSSWFVTILRV